MDQNLNRQNEHLLLLRVFLMTKSYTRFTLAAAGACFLITLSYQVLSPKAWQSTALIQIGQYLDQFRKAKLLEPITTTTNKIHTTAGTKLKLQRVLGTENLIKLKVISNSKESVESAIKAHTDKIAKEHQEIYQKKLSGFKQQAKTTAAVLKESRQRLKKLNQEYNGKKWNSRDAANYILATQSLGRDITTKDSELHATQEFINFASRTEILGISQTKILPRSIWKNSFAAFTLALILAFLISIFLISFDRKKLANTEGKNEAQY